MKRLIVGSIIGNEKDNYLNEWLKNVQSYADYHVIIDDGSIDGTKEVLLDYCKNNKNVSLQRNEDSMFKNDEPKLRNMLWENIRKVAKGGDWVIIVDADEFYDELSEYKTELMRVDNNVIAFRLLDMWNEKQYRVDGHWSPYFHRMFRFKDWDFAIKGKGLHKPCVPEWVINSNNVYLSDVRCKHYSYLRDEDKKKKYEFYKKNVKDSFNLKHALSIMDIKPQLENVEKELPNIMITSLIHNRAWILPQFLNCLNNINYPKDKIKYCFIVNNTSDESLQLLKAWNNESLILEYNFKLSKNHGEHKWDNNLIKHMAIMRNQTLKMSERFDCEYMVNIDSDILFPPNIIKHLVTSDKKIISPVFFAGWGDDSGKRFPQVWDRGGFELSDSLLNLVCSRRTIVRVGGLGAFTCIHKDVWEKGVNYDRVYNLPSDMFGEDRDFCTRASVHGFWLFASTYYDLIHVDNKEMLEDIKTKSKILKYI